MNDDEWIKIEKETPSPQVEVKANEQRTPTRIITEYKTTGIFEDISKDSREKPEENRSG